MLETTLARWPEYSLPYVCGHSPGAMPPTDAWTCRMGLPSISTGAEETEGLISWSHPERVESTGEGWVFRKNSRVVYQDTRQQPSLGPARENTTTTVCF